MARDLDNLPLYDPLVRQGGVYMADIWISSLSTMIETLQGYLSQYGAFVPRVTTEERDKIQSPEEGQMIYLTDATIGPPRTAALQMWQVVADVGQWTVIV
jgi:hypothetical protein